jgi:hypothetical protein
LGSLAAAVRGRHLLRLQVGEPLGSRPADWSWPAGPAAADVLLFSLATPLRASELRWLESVPDGQPVWLLLTLEPEGDGEGARADLQRQWPAADPQRLLFWDGEAESLPAALAPLSDWLDREAPLLRSRTARRRIEALHGLWQADLERLRRREWQQLQRRTQWVVAGGVLVTPLPSLDLLVLAAANGLMLRDNPEMTLAEIEASVALMKAQGIVDSGDSLPDGIGAMRSARIADFYQQMVKAGLYKPGDVDLSKVATLQFVNRKVGNELRKRLGGP